MTDRVQLAPLALTIALSPLPVGPLLMLVLSPDGFKSGAAFSIGWFVGVALATTTLALLSSLLPDLRSGGSSALQTGVPVFLGTVLIIFGVRQWRRRPAPGDEVPMPRWMGAVGRLTPERAALIGLGYAAFRPKNLAAARVIILGSHTDPPGITVSLALFTLMASLRMLGPVLACALGGRAVRAALGRLRLWLVRNMPVITAVTTIGIGIVLVLAGAWALVVRLA